jgi:hypothetical protein
MEWKGVVRDALLVLFVLMCILFPFETGRVVDDGVKPQCRVCVEDPRPSMPLHPIMAAILDGYWH